MGNILLLTSTITPPPGAIELHRTDPKDRLEDYSKALRFYCSLPQTTFDHIAFVENSESDISPLRSIAANSNTRVTFLSFNGLDYPPEWGRAYGEFALLDRAMSEVSALKSMAAGDRLWKVTGRYKVLNISSVIKHAPGAFDLYCDIRARPMPWADLRLFGCTIGGYETFLRGICERVKQSEINTAPEILLYKDFRSWADNNNRVSVYFTREPRILGLRGKDSKNYLSGINFAKYLVRVAQRQIGLRF